MKDTSKTKEQLLAELTQLRGQNTSLTKLINGRISLEPAVEEARLYAESIVETIREPLLVMDADLKIISANRNFYRTFKVNPGETLGSFIYDLGNKQWDIPRLRDLLENILPEKESFDDFEVDHYFQDIGHKIMLLNARRISRKDTGVQLILLAIEDITEHKRLTDLVTESEERYRHLFETASDGIVLLEESEGKITHTNPAAEKMFGSSKKECIGKKLQEIGVLLDMGDFQTVMKNLKKDGIINYTDIPVKSKSGPDIDADIYLVDRATLVQCNIRDVTERKRNEEALEEVLKQSEARYRALFDSAHDAIILMDRDIVIDCNQRTAELFRCPKEQIIGNTTTRFWPERQADGRLSSEVAIEHIKKALRNESSSNEVRHLRADGTLVDTDVTLNVFELNGKKYLQAIIRDITERKQAEGKIRESEKKYRELYDFLPIPVYETDLEANITSANRAIYETIGGTEEDLTRGFKAWQLFSPEDIDKPNKNIQRLLKGEQIKGTEHTLMRLDGSVFPAIVILSVFYSAGKPVGLRGAIVDITERRRAEENLLKTLKDLQESKDMLVQSEKLAAIGRLSAGVAHEILNPVNIISMRLQLLEEEEMSDKLEETLQVCQKQIDRIVKITKDLNQFSRSSAMSMEACNLNSIVEQTLHLTSPRLKVEKITLEIHTYPDLPSVAVDRSRIEQVLMNLINNAVDAMENMDKKELHIQTDQAVSDDSRQWARITVSDTGKGISEAEINKIFDPFFTTKEKGKGTGLGLFICYGIIQDHHGTITAKNNENGGASFIIDLPLSMN